MQVLRLVREINDIIPPFLLTVCREQHYYMIKDLEWATLETRRRKSRLTLMYKLTHGLIDIDTRIYTRISGTESKYLFVV